MRLEFVKVSSDAGQPLFMVWNPEMEAFEEYNGATLWDSWQDFTADLRKSLASRPDYEDLPGEDEEDLEEHEDNRGSRVDKAVRACRASANQTIGQATTRGPFTD